MGLLINVYRTGERDCTNNGISSKSDVLLLVNVEGPTKEDNYKGKLAYLTKGALPGIARIVPACWAEIGEYIPVPEWTMMGGNYGATSDSRFRAAVEQITGSPFYGAVPIHDRIE